LDEGGGGLARTRLTWGGGDAIRETRTSKVGEKGRIKGFTPAKIKEDQGVLASREATEASAREWQGRDYLKHSQRGKDSLVIGGGGDCWVLD